MQLKNFFTKYVVRYSLFYSGLLIGVVSMVLFRNVFVYKTIVIQGATPVDRDQLTRILRHKSVFLNPASTVESLIKTQLPAIKAVKSVVTLPQYLTIEIQYKKSDVAVATDQGYLYVAEDGTVLRKDRAHDKKTPIIQNNFPILHNEYQRSQKLTLTPIMKAIQAVKVLTGEGLTVESVDIDSVDVIACKTRTVKVIFSQTRDFALQTHEVRQIVRRLRLGDLKVATIDLRFDKPILKKE